MVFNKLAEQSNFGTTFGATGGYHAIQFQPTSTITIDTVRVYRTSAVATPGEIGIASAIGTSSGTITWLSRNPSASFNASGWVENTIPSITLTAGNTYFLVWGIPTMNEAANFGCSGSSNGSFTGVTNCQRTHSNPSWQSMASTNYFCAFELGTTAAPPTISLTAVPNETTNAVDLTVSNATGAITVTRYVQGQSPVGTPVRGSFVNGRLVADYDAPLNTDLVYIAKDTLGQSPQVDVRLESATAVLAVMANPTLSTDVIVLADDSQNYQGQSTAHLILGTNTPLVTVQPPAYRAGTYRMLLPTVDDWLQLRAILMDGGVMLLRSPCQTEYLDTAFIMVSARNTLPWSAAPPRHRIFELDYQATAPDSTPPQEVAWSWADVPAEFAGWADVPLAIPTWADMVSHLPDPELERLPTSRGY